MNRFLEWATNINHAAGADLWSGQPNKTDIAAGKVATGRIPEELPPAEETNMWRWLVAAVFVSCTALRVDNWAGAYTGGAVNPSEPLISGHYDPTTETHWVLTDNAGVGCNHISSVGGMYWLTTASPALATVPHGGADDGLGTRAAVSATIVDTLYYDTAFAGWALWAGLPGPGVNFRSVDSDGVGLWVAVSDAGLVYSSTGPGVAFAPVATPPAAGAIVGTVFHSRHYAGEVDDYDAGNAIWVITAVGGGGWTIYSTSTDGATWTAWATVDVGAIPGVQRCYHEWAYSATDRAWYTIGLTDRILYKSLDNGATWVAMGLVPGVVAWVSTQDNIGMSCDRGSDVVIAISNQINALDVIVSSDGGVTQRLIYMPRVAAFNTGAIALWYGGGRFMLGGNTLASAVAPQIYTSLRME